MIEKMILETSSKRFLKLIGDGILGKMFYSEVDYLHAITPSYLCYPWSVKKETGGSILQAGEPRGRRVQVVRRRRSGRGRRAT